MALEQRGDDLAVEEHHRQRRRPRRLHHQCVACRERPEAERRVGPGRVLRRIHADHPVGLARQHDPTLALLDLGVELGELQLRHLRRRALDHPAHLPLRQASRVALPDQDLDELVGALDDRVVVLGGHCTAHVQWRSRELAARARGRLQRLGALPALAPGTATHHHVRRCVAEIHLAQVERSLQVERPHRVRQERRRPYRVVPPLAVAVLTVDVQRLRLHAGTSASLEAALTDSAGVSTSCSSPALNLPYAPTSSRPWPE